MANKFKARLIMKMIDITLCASKEIIGAENIMALAYQPVY